MKRNELLLYYFFVKVIFLSFLLGSLMYFMVAPDTEWYLHSFVILFLSILLPIYAFRYVIESAKQITLTGDILTYSYGIFIKDSEDYQKTSIKLVKMRSGWLIDAFELSHLIITCKSPININVTRKEMQISDSMVISYYCHKEEALYIRDSVNKRISSLEQIRVVN